MGSNFGKNQSCSFSNNNEIHLLSIIFVPLIIVPNWFIVWPEHTCFSFPVKHSSGCDWVAQHFHCTSVRLGIFRALYLCLCGAPFQACFSSCGLLAMNAPSLTQLMNLPTPYLTWAERWFSVVSLCRWYWAAGHTSFLLSVKLDDLHISLGWVGAFIVAAFQLQGSVFAVLCTNCKTSAVSKAHFSCHHYRHIYQLNFCFFPWASLLPHIHIHSHAHSYPLTHILSHTCTLIHTSTHSQHPHMLKHIANSYIHLDSHTHTLTNTLISHIYSHTFICTVLFSTLFSLHCEGKATFCLLCI